MILVVLGTFWVLYVTVAFTFFPGFMVVLGKVIEVSGSDAFIFRIINSDLPEFWM